MNGAVIFLFVMLIVFWLNNESIKSSFIQLKIKKRKNKGVRENMEEIVKTFIGESCVIYTINSSQTVIGEIKKIEDGWLSVQIKDSLAVINIEYIVQIKQHPINKKGKKKTILF